MTETHHGMLHIEVYPGLLGVYADLDRIIYCPVCSRLRLEFGRVLIREYRPFYGHQDVQQSNG